MSKKQPLAIVAKKIYQKQHLTDKEAWWDELITIQNHNATEYNQAIEKANSRWLLFLQDNEIVSDKFQKAIKQFIAQADKKGYTGAYFIKQLHFLGRTTQFGHFGKKKILRLGRRVGQWQENNNQLVWDFPGRKYIIKPPLYFQPYNGVTDALQKINKASRQAAEEKNNREKKGRIFKIVCCPIFTFCCDYVFKLGCLDGYIGFSLATLRSFQRFLTEAKLWLRQQRKVNNAQ